jgi:P2-related tail formation protein
MAAIEEGDDEVKRRGQKEGLVANILRILKTEQGLTRHLNRKDIYISELGEIHVTSVLSSGGNG